MLRNAERVPPLLCALRLCSRLRGQAGGSAHCMAIWNGKKLHQRLGRPAAPKLGSEQSTPWAPPLINSGAGTAGACLDTCTDPKSLTLLFPQVIGGGALGVVGWAAKMK